MAEVQKRYAFQRPYSITVLEDIKGSFNYSELIVEVGAVEGCGTSVSYGETLYLISSARDEWGNSASVCNIKRSHGYAEDVRKLIDKKK